MEKSHNEEFYNLYPPEIVRMIKLLTIIIFIINLLQTLVKLMPSLKNYVSFIPAICIRIVMHTYRGTCVMT
jgi:hypothetical protein